MGGAEELAFPCPPIHDDIVTPRHLLTLFTNIVPSLVNDIVPTHVNDIVSTLVNNLVPTYLNNIVPNLFNDVIPILSITFLNLSMMLFKYCS